jgi:cysteine desulfurase
VTADVADGGAPLYFDWAASAPLRDEARAVLIAHLDPKFGNASSLHAPGRAARQALTAARRAVAVALGAARDDVVFTGNGSEANLLALVGAARALPPGRRHVLTTPIEHPSVLEPLESLARDGALELELLPVDREGRVEPDAVERALRPSTGLVSIQLANNEIGTIQPVGEIARRLRPRNVVLHSDASQAVGKIAVRLDELGVDLLTASAHKFGGPRGVGIVLKRDGVALRSPLSSGRQESGLRGGTEDVAACAAAAAACTAAVAEQPGLADRLSALAAELRARLRDGWADVTIYSPERWVVPGLVNFALPGVRGDWLVAALDRAGVAVSHGAACSSRAALPSHVLLAIGADAAAARGAVRVSMGRATTRDDLDSLLARLRRAVSNVAHA